MQQIGARDHEHVRVHPLRGERAARGDRLRHHHACREDVHRVALPVVAGPLARVDLRVTEEGRIYVIEVNPNCYLEAKSEFATAAQKHGVEYPALINRIVELASARYSR